MFCRIRVQLELQGFFFSHAASWLIGFGSYLVAELNLSVQLTTLWNCSSNGGLDPNNNNCSFSRALSSVQNAF